MTRQIEICNAGRLARLLLAAALAASCTAELPAQPNHRSLTQLSVPTETTTSENVSTGMDQPEEQFSLGLRYVNGDGVAKDDREAASWFRKAAKQGIAAAQYNLAVMLYSGTGVEKNYTEAAYWFSRAAEQGVAAAQNNLAVMLYSGTGLEKNYTEAAKWFQKAAEQGAAPAQGCSVLLA